MKIIWIIAILLFSSISWLYGQKPIFNHIAIHVKDLQKSRTFYQEVVGLDSIPNPFRDDKHAWFAIGAGTELHIISGAGKVTKHHQDNHLCFRVPSVDVFAKKLFSTGISYKNARGKQNEMTIRPDGVKQIYFTDPDGHWIEINDVKQ